MAIKIIQSTVPFQDPQGNVLANGILILDLNAPAEIGGSGGQVAPSSVAITLTSAGVIPASTNLWANDQLNPSNTFYSVRIYSSTGLLVSGPLAWSITGPSPIDLSQETPVASLGLNFALPFIGPNMQQFTVSGTFTIPAVVTKAKVTVIGGGGAGGGSNGANCGLGGGAGGMAIKWLTGLTPGLTITITVGLGGTGISASDGNPGTLSSISSGTQTIATVTANPGNGGNGNRTGITGGGTGGGATGGDLNVSGNQGPAVNSGVFGQQGAGTILGAGGTATINSIGANATGFGSGGGGAQGTGPFAGGNGTGGIVIFEWIA